MSKPPLALVTGGTGFIGRHVAARLLAAGFRVRSFALAGAPAPPDWAGRIECVEGDIADGDRLLAAADGASLLVHLAAVVGLAGDYDRQWSVIAGGTRNACEVAAVTRARLVVTSSIAVYGDRIQSGICREDDPFGAFQGAYGRAKQEQERIALAFARERALEICILRPANVYGLGGGGAWGDRLLDLIGATGGAAFGAADTNDAGLVHVENLADAILLAATHPSASGAVFNVCDEGGISWGRFMDDMAGLAGRPPVPRLDLDAALALARANEDPARLIPPRDPALPSLEGLNLVGFANRFDSRRIRERLGWRPRLAYAAAFERMRTDIASARYSLRSPPAR
ncbi:MAG: NAD(P)-dependent oxidoreductase [Alphaproteobacteria bacterium]|nr:NAD(P)-dependent oxidoreductase [Alphaproteobacteria bacterium]